MLQRLDSHTKNKHAKFGMDCVINEPPTHDVVIKFPESPALRYTQQQGSFVAFLRLPRLLSQVKHSVLELCPDLNGSVFIYLFSQHLGSKDIFQCLVDHVKSKI